MVGEREEVLEAERWARGIEEVHRRIEARFYRSEPRRPEAIKGRRKVAEIEEKEFENIDGTIKRYRVIRGPNIRVEHSDGTIEEIKDTPAEFRAQEDVLRSEWLLYNFPVGPLETRAC